MNKSRRSHSRQEGNMRMNYIILFFFDTVCDSRESSSLECDSKRFIVASARIRSRKRTQAQEKKWWICNKSSIIIDARPLLLREILIDSLFIQFACRPRVADHWSSSDSTWDFTSSFCCKDLNLEMTERERQTHTQEPSIQYAIVKIRNWLVDRSNG